MQTRLSLFKRVYTNSFFTMYRITFNLETTWKQQFIKIGKHQRDGKKPKLNKDEMAKIGKG